MSPPACERAEPIAPHVQCHAHIAPLERGADGAARHPYHRAKHILALSPAPCLENVRLEQDALIVNNFFFRLLTSL